jgi:squalene synthase HpnC
MLLVNRDPEAGASGSREAASREAALQAKERAENFPVALRLLPQVPRRHLQAVYDVVRTIDDLGDEAAGDRVAQLDAFRDDLTQVWGGRPEHPVLRRLQPAAAVVSEEPFADLVAANLQDQRVSSYATRTDLLGSCALSANPIGRLVLQVFGVDTPERRALSDDVCTALQLLEHWQDVAEDRRAGRVYLPASDLARHGVRIEDLDRTRSTPQVSALLQGQTTWAAQLLDSAVPLVRGLNGWARVAVAGYAAGGRATVLALRRPGVDVLQVTPRPTRSDTARLGLRLLAGRP